MRKPSYDASVLKRTASLTLNSDLYANAKSPGINISNVAEDAFAVAYIDERRAKLAAEIQQDLTAARTMPKATVRLLTSYGSTTIGMTVQFDVFVNQSSLRDGPICSWWSCSRTSLQRPAIDWSHPWYRSERSLRSRVH